MTIKFDNYRKEPREMADGIIDLVSTSTRTSKTSPIILNRTDTIQTMFEPTLVDNDKEPTKCVSGKLVHERKRKHDDNFPTEKLTRKSVKVGDIMEISLKTNETYALYEGLKDLYSLYDDIGQTPIGSNSYTRVDNNFRQFQNLIQNDSSAARLLSQNENLELVKLLLQIITQTDSLESLKNSLKELEQSSVTSLFNATGIERINRVLQILEKNLNNEDEEYWHSVFKEEQWLLSQLFSVPCTIFDDKAYVGGKGISNKNGNICDFIYQNKLTNNIALIEIKTPCTPLFASQYRGTYSFSADMSGGINQVLNYKDKLLKEYYTLSRHSGKVFEALNPKCCLIIGKVSELNAIQIETLEQYRNSITNVSIITFDELILKAKDTALIFKPDDTILENEKEDAIIYDLDDGDLPF